MLMMKERKMKSVGALENETGSGTRATGAQKGILVSLFQ